MFPNPQDALPLPPRPNLERYKKLAKDLVKACKSGDVDAIERWAEKWIEALGRSYSSKKDQRLRRWLDRKIDDVEGFARRTFANPDPDKSPCRLADAQFIIARSHGFESWPKFAKHLLALSQKSSSIARFETAVDAIVKGDLRTLKRLLLEDPELIRRRSTRQHKATLLHYVSANGVEGYRQKTPKNVVRIAEVLLNAGSDVNAEADMYAGNDTTLGLVSTSVHPFRAGVQNPLMQILIDHGANIDHPDSAGKGRGAVMACLANGRGEAAVYLAERGARLSLEAAAGVGQLDVVRSFFKKDRSLKSSVSKREVEAAFLYACAWGRNDVIKFLLDQGVDPAKHSGDGQTALHQAVIRGQLATIELLLKLKAPLELRNMYGGTVLGQTLWSAAHGGDPEVYSAIIETLIAAGAKVPERHVPVNPRIDNLLRRYGSVPEPKWYWYGEKPRKTRS